MADPTNLLQYHDHLGSHVSQTKITTNLHLDVQSDHGRGPPGLDLGSRICQRRQDTSARSFHQASGLNRRPVGAVSSLAAIHHLSTYPSPCPIRTYE